MYVWRYFGAYLFCDEFYFCDCCVKRVLVGFGRLVLGWVLAGEVVWVGPCFCWVRAY